MGWESLGTHSWSVGLFWPFRFPELTHEGLGEVPTEGNCSTNIL